MKISFLAIGDELLSGRVAEANGKYLAERVALSGLEMKFMLLAGDDEREIITAFNFLQQTSETIIVSGGLGPTPDDLTIEVFAKYTGLELEFAPEIMEKIDLRFKLRDLATPASNKKQALIPKGAKIIPNPLGTAPGIEAVFQNHCFLFLPGVPAEFRKMVDDSVLPRLRELASDQKSLAVKTLRTYGLPESAIADRLAKLQFDPRLKIAFLPELPEIYIRLSALLADQTHAEQIVKAGAEQIKAELKEYVFSDDDEPMELVVGKLLKKSGFTLAVAESCTGGLVAKKLTDIPGSSDYFLGGFITYSNQLKTSELGVSEELLAAKGAVSDEVARAMAEGARNRSAADIAIGITGIAGPEGGTGDKPIGLVYIALADRKGTWSQRLQFLPWSRAAVRELAAETALEIIRRRILGLRMPGEKA
jgi:nicotinamide-nucleotide amidase